MTDLKHLLRRSEDEFPAPSPVLAAYFGGLLTGGLAVFFGAVMYVGVAS